MTSDVGIPEQRYAGEPGDDFPEELQALPTEFRRDIAEPGDISAGVRETRYETGLYRIGTERHHDRDRPSLSFERGNRRIVVCDEHLHLDAHGLPCELRKSFQFALAVAKLPSGRFPFSLTTLPQRLPGCTDQP